MYFYCLCIFLFCVAVVKFRRRARFLEFVVQVVQKALSEGLVDTAIEWCEDSVLWLIRYIYCYSNSGYWYGVGLQTTATAF